MIIIIIIIIIIIFRIKLTLTYFDFDVIGPRRFLFVSFFFFFCRKCGAYSSKSVGPLLTHKNGDFGMISVARRNWAAPILKVDRHISDRFLPLF